MSLITIQVNSTKSVTINNDLWNYSKFQLAFMKNLLKTKGFRNLVLVNYNEYKGQTVREAQWMNVLWYVNDVLHCQRIGVTRILSKTVTSAK